MFSLPTIFSQDPLDWEIGLLPLIVVIITNIYWMQMSDRCQHITCVIPPHPNKHPLRLGCYIPILQMRNQGKKLRELVQGHWRWSRMRPVPSHKVSFLHIWKRTPFLWADTTPIQRAWFGKHRGYLAPVASLAKTPHAGQKAQGCARHSWRENSYPSLSDSRDAVPWTVFSVLQPHRASWRLKLSWSQI